MLLLELGWLTTKCHVVSKYLVILAHYLRFDDFSLTACCFYYLVLQLLRSVDLNGMIFLKSGGTSV